jgi:Kef-type K+ transport system membrane component KefB
MPLAILFSLFFIMLGIDKDLPKNLQMPTPIGLAFILPVWALIFANLYFSKRLFNQPK